MCRNIQTTQLNDQLRKHGIGGHVMITRGIQSLDAWLREAVINAVREFDTFDVSNDPHEEHDYGDVVVAGTKTLWKIDYYDPTLSVTSVDPSDTKKTARVMTIMLAEEY